jgi:hypothetical protein
MLKGASRFRRFSSSWTVPLCRTATSYAKWRIWRAVLNPTVNFELESAAMIAVIRGYANTSSRTSLGYLRRIFNAFNGRVTGTITSRSNPSTRVEIPLADGATKTVTKQFGALDLDL